MLCSAAVLYLLGLMQCGVIDSQRLHHFMSNGVNQIGRHLSIQIIRFSYNE